MSRTILRFDDYEFDPARHELRKQGARLELPRKPFRVLELLLRRPGELVTRDELFTFLWPDSHVSFEHGLNTAVNSLRQVLGESHREHRFIETRPGLGYRFCAPVKEAMEPIAAARPRPSGQNGAAFQDCLKGRYFLDSMCEDETHKALAFFNSASVEETCCSLAHAGIADAYCQLALLGSTSSDKLAGQARSSIEIALRKNPDLPDAHVSAGRVKMIFDWDWDGAQESVTHALALDPNSVSAHTLRASLLCILGRYEEARQACSNALAFDPLSFPANLQLAACLYAARDFTGTTEQCWKILTLTPRFAPAQIRLALAYEQLAMYEEALVEFQNAQTCTGFEAAAISGMGQVFAVTGLHHEAEHSVRELSRRAKNRYISPYWYAAVCAGRRQESRVLSYLEESVRQRDTALLSLKTDARFDAMRQHERFQIVLHRLGIDS
jgi:DNA-binding winged helix-turn-helix (wHTH) protein/tetratricopeptide (TPR) repeat protein